MNLFAYLVMFAWAPVIFYFFTHLPVRRAVVQSFIIGWLFLPVASIKITTGIPPYSKTSATCYAVLLAIIIFEPQRLSAFQFHWLDLPIAILCLCSFASSMTNDLGPYDGLASVVQQTVTWGVPYFIGRLYLSNLDGLRKLVIGIFIGGLVYVPLCLYEIRLTTSLHELLYGFGSPGSSFGQNFRYGGYRPEVFMDTGLMLGVWMMAATLCGFWLWQSGIVTKLWNLRIEWLVAILVATTVLVKATGATMLLGLGVFVMFVAKRLQNSLIVLVLIAGICYLFMGVSGIFPGDEIVSIVSTNLDADRAGSLEVRFDNEKFLGMRASEKMIFGWGGWGRNRVIDPRTGKDTSITDSLWIIMYGTSGLVGLISLFTSMLLPVFRFVQLYSANLWLNNKVAPAAAIAVVIVLFTMDCLVNAMVNPIYILACGALTGLVIKHPRVSMPRPLGLSVTDR